MAAATPKKHQKIPAGRKQDTAKPTGRVSIAEAAMPDKYIKWIVFAFALLLYANTLDLKYALDDSLMITDNNFTKKGASGIKDILTNDAFVGFLGKNNLLPGGRYRPLPQVMFAIEKEFFGFNPFVGHLINILLYAFTCMLLFIILNRLFINYKTTNWYLGIPFTATMLFTAHPLHTEAVANIKGRDEILCLFFCLLVVLFTLQYLEKKKIYLLIANLFLFLLALLSKENALTFAAIIPLILFVFFQPRLKDYLIVSAPLLGGIAAYFALRIGIIGVQQTSPVRELLNDPFVGSTLIQKYATIFLTWLKYIWLLIFPHPLTHDYYPKQIPIVNFSDIRVILSILIYGTLLVYALLKIKSKNIVAFGILFFIFSFSIVSNFFFVIGTFMNERFMFTSLLGYTMILAYLIAGPLQKKIRNAKTYRTTALVLLAVILSAYSAKTVSRNRVWMDDLTLFTTDVKVSSNSTKCNTSAGGKLIEKADSTDNEAQKQKYLVQAVKYLNKAIDIYPANNNALLLLGNAYFKQKEYAKSRDCYHRCLLINPKNKLALNNLKNVAILSNRDKAYVEALKDYRMLLKYQPAEAEHYFGLGVAYRGLNKFDSALISLGKAVELKSDYAEAISKTGEIYGQDLNRIDLAESSFLQAIAVNPKDASSLENLGIVYGIKHDYKKSIDYLEKALELKPEKYQIYLNLAETYRIMGDMASATAYLEKAKKYQPSDNNSDQ
ncbi:MAG TPA: tetratricopeptide repeat protein [Bacteroidales bacterium]|nr:tetratricopeptide repeat protein [Bacteroidales bacterium]HNZ42897.1 tetratricopeptide repeat protein [Bacteroidales bacterium]HPB24967.1 tetratricopeptide repeat protein [Bacteroidales bacterium]HPI29428.1 tetratricopeptide repeat protein [Bacteroidales bacterium]HQN16430.1 tetratricopeptide repeat protein [Bacteroidales bacterium]